MKTFDEITVEVISEFKSKLNYITKNDKSSTRMPYKITQEIINESAKRYARQCCEDLRSRCAKEAKTYDDYHRGHQTTYVDESSILNTEIILP